MSHGSGGFGKAVCTSTMKRPTDEVCEILGDDCRSPKKEDFCAAHLARRRKILVHAGDGREDRAAAVAVAVLVLSLIHI